MEDINEQQAKVFFEQAYRAQMRGRYSEAIELYQRSLATHPTAEAHTFLGWTYSLIDRYEEAIAECEQAIALDPEFGNPYNDIGSYLIELNRPGEAIQWLEKATQAGRYDAPHFPYINLGRAYEKMGRYKSALMAYNQAMAFKPAYFPAHWGKYALLGRMN